MRWFLLLALFPMLAQAGEARLRIKLPAMTADNITPTPASGPDSIAKVRLQVGTCTINDAFGSKITEVMLTTPVADPLVLTGWNPQTYCLRASAITVAGVEGAPGPLLKYVVAGLTPGSITIELAQ